jgi:hypothetical protein
MAGVVKHGMISQRTNVNCCNVHPAAQRLIVLFAETLLLVEIEATVHSQVDPCAPTHGPLSKLLRHFSTNLDRKFRLLSSSHAPHVSSVTSEPRHPSLHQRTKWQPSSVHHLYLTAYQNTQPSTHKMPKFPGWKRVSPSSKRPSANGTARLAAASCLPQSPSSCVSDVSW